MAAILLQGRRSVPGPLESERKAQREPRLSRDEEEKAAVRMVPRGTGLQRLPERAPDVDTPVCKGKTRQQSHTSLPRVTTIP